MITGCGGIETETNPIVREEALEFIGEAGLLRDRARLLEDDGNFKGALVIYEDLADDYPDSPLLPEIIFRIGRCLEEEGEFAEAIDWYEDLVDDYPDSVFASEAQFRIGRSLEEKDELLEAFEAYQKLFDEFPGKGSLSEILNREYAIGEAFMNGRKRIFLFFRIRSGLGTAEDIFRAILDNATFSKVSTRAQYSLGLILQMQDEYEGAISEYNQVLTNYPGTELIPSALFNIGVCYYEEAASSDYDDREVNKAIENLTRFIRRFPDDPNRDEAEEKIREMMDQKAEKAYAIADYYNTSESPNGARIYYQEILDKYPESRYARLAENKLAELPEPDTEEAAD